MSINNWNIDSGTMFFNYFIYLIAHFPPKLLKKYEGRLFLMIFPDKLRLNYTIIRGKKGNALLLLPIIEQIDSPPLRVNWWLIVSYFTTLLIIYGKAFHLTRPFTLALQTVLGSFVIFKLVLTFSKDPFILLTEINSGLWSNDEYNNRKLLKL